MAKESREMVCSNVRRLVTWNYRTEIKVAGDVQKIEVKKYCPPPS